MTSRRAPPWGEWGKWARLSPAPTSPITRDSQGASRTGPRPPGFPAALAAVPGLSPWCLSLLGQEGPAPFSTESGLLAPTLPWEQRHLQVPSPGFQPFCEGLHSTCAARLGFRAFYKLGKPGGFSLLRPPFAMQSVLHTFCVGERLAGHTHPAQPCPGAGVLHSGNQNFMDVSFGTKDLRSGRSPAPLFGLLIPAQEQRLALSSASESPWSLLLP